MESRGISPMFGVSQFLKQRSQFSSVDGATGLRLRFFISSNQISARSRNVLPWFERTTLSKCAAVSAPLAAIISLALRFRSDAKSLPGPEIGQILSRTRCLFSWPATSFQNRRRTNCRPPECNHSDQIDPTWIFSLSAFLPSLYSPYQQCSLPPPLILFPF